MCATGRQKAMRRYPPRTFFQREKQRSSSLIESLGEKVASPDTQGRPQDISRVEAPPGLKLLDRGFGLPIHQPDPSTPPPTTGKARFEFQSPVDQCCRGGDILAEIGEHIRNVAK